LFLPLLDAYASVRSMQSRSIRSRCLSLLAALPLIVLAATAAERAHLSPKFAPGQSFRYGIESRTTASGITTTPIANPEGGSKSAQALHLIIRLDVLDVLPSGSARLRATYERSSADTETDALDLKASKLADQFAGLEGHSFEFSLGPGGKLEAIADSSASSSSQPGASWLESIFPDSTLPQNGVAIGQKWKSDIPVESAVLSGLAWRTDSTYLHNEPCSTAAPQRVPDTSAADQAGCASILTRFEIVRLGSTGVDATPEDYRRNGLRTSGTWTGSGERLEAISLTNGLLISSTQTSTQNMDYRVTSSGTGSSLHQVGKSQTQTEITLLPNQP
jgi:hypothetical protein